MQKVNKKIQSKIITAILCPFTSGCMTLIGHELSGRQNNKRSRNVFCFKIIFYTFSGLMDELPWPVRTQQLPTLLVPPSLGLLHPFARRFGWFQTLRNNSQHHARNNKVGSVCWGEKGAFRTRYFVIGIGSREISRV